LLWPKQKHQAARQTPSNDNQLWSTAAVHFSNHGLSALAALLKLKLVL
jgi:hypothetical protein